MKLAHDSSRVMVAEIVHDNRDEDIRAGSLLRLAADGETLAFEELFARYSRRMVAWARTRSRNEEDAEEAAQDAWVTLWRMLPTLQVRETGIGLLATLAQRSALSMHRTRGALKRGGGDIHAHDEELIAHYHDLHAHRRRGVTVHERPKSFRDLNSYRAALGPLMGEIPMEYVSLLDLVYVKGQTAEDIAKARGIRTSEAVASIHSGLSIARHWATKMPPPEIDAEPDECDDVLAFG